MSQCWTPAGARNRNCNRTTHVWPRSVAVSHRVRSPFPRAQVEALEVQAQVQVEEYQKQDGNAEGEEEDEVEAGGGGGCSGTAAAG